MTDHEMMIISALRYALPRRSYIMSCTDEYITDMLKGKVTENFLGVAIQDIEQHIKYESLPSKKSTLDYDWNPLLKRLKLKK